MLTSRQALAAIVVLSAISLSACGKSGDLQKAAGQMESAAGDMTGSQKLKAEGRDDLFKGDAKSLAGDVKDIGKH